MTLLKFSLIIIACIAMFLGIAFAQDDALNGGTLRGLITELTPAQNPIEGVKVKIVAQDGTEFTTKTDANGDYKKSGIPAGRYLISIYKEGYSERSGKPVTIVEGGDHFVSLKMAEKGFVAPRFEVPARRADPTLDRKIESLLQRVGESVSKHYNLDKKAVKMLRHSIIKSIEIALRQDENLRVFAKVAGDGNAALLELLLLAPPTKQALAKHLTETQIQEYLKLNQARRHRNQQAIARQIVVLLDQELSLTNDQHQNIEQLLLDTTEREPLPTAMSMMISSLNAAHLVHYKLKISLDGILTQTQSKVWHGLVNASPEELREIIVPPPEGEIKDRVDTTKPDNKDNTPESQERIKQMQQISEAKLMAHAELLGPLNEDASQRLQLAAKGTLQQYLETHGKGPTATYQETAAKLSQAFEAGEITREEAAEKLKVVMSRGSNIIGYPLYQQAIKDVLPEDALMQYRTRQTERENLRKQVLRDRMIANIDESLLLDTAQREHLETIIARLTIPSSTEAAIQEMLFQLPQRVDLKMLSPWQQREFRNIFGPPMMKE